mmetsp:Transcript_32989/g.79533  ORF Transcript_32989/g.79533 Transcript_32989/m.79533 type:complete len:274 (-) Transcript_32989:2-823(-)
MMERSHIQCREVQYYHHVEDNVAGFPQQDLTSQRSERSIQDTQHRSTLLLRCTQLHFQLLTVRQLGHQLSKKHSDRTQLVQWDSVQLDQGLLVADHFTDDLLSFHHLLLGGRQAVGLNSPSQMHQSQWHQRDLNHFKRGINHRLGTSFASLHDADSQDHSGRCPQPLPSEDFGSNSIQWLLREESRTSTFLTNHSYPACCCCQHDEADWAQPPRFCESNTHSGQPTQFHQHPTRCLKGRLCCTLQPFYDTASVLNHGEITNGRGLHSMLTTSL